MARYYLNLGFKSQNKYLPSSIDSIYLSVFTTFIVQKMDESIVSMDKKLK